MKNLDEIIEQLVKANVSDREELEAIKREYSEENDTNLPTNVELLKAYHNLVQKKRIQPNKKIESLLKTRPMRSLSGIVNITVLTKPFGCPGHCIFCPNEAGFPKSYLKGEPAADRAFDLKFNPYLQVQKRLEMLNDQGHPIDKMELRIVGGSWSCYPKSYQNWFVRECYRAADDFQRKRKYSRRFSLEKLQKINETARVRIVGMSIETRPDLITPNELRHLRRLGVTMVEVGVQTIFDEIHQKNATNLSAAIIAQATKLLKDAGFKVLYHIMPNLYGSDLVKDREMACIIFNDSRFKPDWLKIYPTVVLENTPLYRLYQEGKYQPYTDEELINLLIAIKTELPYWVRVARIIRDIPAQKVVGGTQLSNLREIIQKRMKERGLVCHCIRCREVKENYNPKEKIYLFREDYEASDGREVFLSFENKERTKLFSLLRLRQPSFQEEPIFKSLKGAALIREIKTFGELVPLSEDKIAPQHKGLGKKLMREAERIAIEEFGLKKIAVIAGVGVREYFRHLGYKLEETYMVKNVNPKSQKSKRRKSKVKTLAYSGHMEKLEINIDNRYLLIGRQTKNYR